MAEVRKRVAELEKKLAMVKPNGSVSAIRTAPAPPVAVVRAPAMDFLSFRWCLLMFRCEEVYRSGVKTDKEGL